MNNEQTNPAAVQQIKDARANKMGQLTPKPKTVVRATTGPMAQGSGIRIVKGYVNADGGYEAYGGKKHRHLAPPKQIMKHLEESHGWDDGDLERALMANPTEHLDEFHRTLRGHHASEHAARVQHDTEGVHVPDDLPDDIKNMKLDKSKQHKHRHLSPVPIPDLAEHLEKEHDWDPGQAHRHVMLAPSIAIKVHNEEHPSQANGFHVQNHQHNTWDCKHLGGTAPCEHTSGGGPRIEETMHNANHEDLGPHMEIRPGDHSSLDCNKVPDELPDDIKNMKLDKAFAHEWNATNRSMDASLHAAGEDDAAAQEKMKTAHPPISPGEFVQKTEERGIHSGLMPTTGAIHALPGYARHQNLINSAHVNHPYSTLMGQHGWVRLSGDPGSSGRQIDMVLQHGQHTQRQREALEDISSYKHAHGGRIHWECRRGYEACASGNDHESLMSHLSGMQKSRVWLRMQAKGFEGRPVSLKRTKRGLAFSKSVGDHLVSLPTRSAKETAESSYTHALVCPDGHVHDAGIDHAGALHEAGAWRHRRKMMRIGIEPARGGRSQAYVSSDALPTEAQNQTIREFARRTIRVGHEFHWSCYGPGHQAEGTDMASYEAHHAFKKSIRTVVLVKSMSDVRSIKRFTAKHVRPEHWDAADNWLHGAKQTIEERTGGEPIHHEGIQIGRAPAREHVAQGLAAMSPRRGWGSGAFAFDKVHGREMVGNKDNRGVGLGNSVRRTRTAIRGGGMGSGRSGKKTRALADLIQGGSSLPMDVHADRVVHYGRKPDHALGQVDGKRHDEHADAFRSASADMGHDPRRFFVATWHAARDWKGKTSTGIRAARANEDRSGQPNVLQHTGLWPGSTRDPKLLMNSKSVWGQLPQGLRSEVKLGRMPRGEFSRLVMRARYSPEMKRIEVGPNFQAEPLWPGGGRVRRARSDRNWSVAHEMGHHMHTTRHQMLGANDWHSLPSHEKDYLLTGVNKAAYRLEDHGAEGLANGYAHLFTGQGGRLKANAPQAHAMLSAKLDNAKKYWKSQATYKAAGCLEGSGDTSPFSVADATLIKVMPKAAEAGV